MNTILAAGIQDVIPMLQAYAPLIGALSSVALGIAGAYLIVNHTKQGANAAAGVGNYDATLEANAQGDFCPSCGVWNAVDEVQTSGGCTACGARLEMNDEADESPFQMPAGGIVYDELEASPRGSPFALDDEPDMSFLDSGASGLWPHACEGCGVTILNPDATHCNECSGAGGTSASPFQLP